VSFLGRIAARASAKAVAAGGVRSSPVASESIPAMTSGSPLVRFDQRLTLPTFSEFGVLPAPGASTAELDGVDGLAPGPGETSPPAATSRVASILAERPLPLDGVAGRAGPVSPMAEASSGVPGENLNSATRTIAPSVDTFMSSRTSTSGVADRSRDIQAPRWRGDEGTLPATEIAVGKQGAPIRQASVGQASVGQASVGQASVGQTPVELTPNRSVLDTIARLNAWMRTEGREIEGQALDESSGRPSTALPAPGVATALPEAPARTDEDTGFSDAPMISIGRLEIEVVPPAARERSSLPQPAPQRRQQSAPRTALSAASGERRSFGWRQR